MLSYIYRCAVRVTHGSQLRIHNGFRHPRQRALIRRQQPDVYISADPGVEGGPAHVDGAQCVKHEPKRYAMHYCNQRSGDARRCSDGVLDVVEMCASWGCATA